MSIPTPQTVHQQFIPIKSSVIFLFPLYISLEAKGKLFDVGLALNRVKYHGNLQVLFLFYLGLAPTLLRTTRRRCSTCSRRLFRPFPAEKHWRRDSHVILLFFIFQLNQHDRISILSLIESTKNLWITNGISIMYFVKPAKALSGIAHPKELLFLEQWAKRSSTDAKTEC